MSTPMFVILVASLVILAWLCLTEFSYLPGNLIGRVYKSVARGYEKKWTAAPYSSDAIEAELFVAPLQRALGEGVDARLLDLACGTGRISLMVARQPWFHGTVHAVDFSAAMLEQFAKSLNSLEAVQRERISIEQADLANWVAPVGNTYDAISLTEACELLPDYERTIAEIVTCLKPEGLLLLTKPPDQIAWLFFGRKQTKRQMYAVLARHGFGNVKTVPWRRRYSVVHAWKTTMP